MKNSVFILAIFVMVGCTSINYSELQQSSAKVSNLEVGEIGKPFSNTHKLDLKFDYTIEQYHDVRNLYSCMVLFALNEGGKMHSYSKTRKPCSIDAQSGTISLTWDTPLSASVSAGYGNEVLEQMQLPLKFHVTIHQRQSKEKHLVIGMSEAMYLNPKI